MTKGPKLNHIRRHFTTRDNLGIDGVSNTLQAELCPVVNTVTPRAFYWPFMVWNYYDYLTSTDKDRWGKEDFNIEFLKKNDYYFVLSNLMHEDSDRDNLVGKEKTATYLNSNENGLFEYRRDYFLPIYGGMQYYNAGCLTLGFITDKGNDGKNYSFPRITEEVGKPMALAFEKIIKDTEYFRQYRLKDTYIPRNVLEEYGNIVTIDLKAFDECKALLKKALFQRVHNKNLDNENLIGSSQLLQFLSEQNIITNPNLSQMRNILYDYFSPRGNGKEHPENLNKVIKGWECVIGRQYFTIAIELIWKYMVSLLVRPMTLEDWISTSFSQSANTWNFDLCVREFLEECNYDFEEREKLALTGARGSRSIDNNIEAALKILFSVHNRFENRDDIDQDFLKMGDDISIYNLGKLIEKFKDRPIREFIVYIMDNWIVKRHQIVAFNKMLQGRDGYYFEFNDGMYSSKGVIPTPDFQGIRLIQLFQVMIDLDMIKR